MIGSPSWLKNSASPPPPDLVVGRLGKSPCTATRSLRAAIPSCLWRAVGTSTSSAQIPDPCIMTRQPQRGYSPDQRPSLFRDRRSPTWRHRRSTPRGCAATLGAAASPATPSVQCRDAGPFCPWFRRLSAHELAPVGTQPSSRGLIRDRPASRCQPSQSEPDPRLLRDIADYGTGRTGGRLGDVPIFWSGVSCVHGVPLDVLQDARERTGSRTN